MNLIEALQKYERVRLKSWPVHLYCAYNKYNYLVMWYVHEMGHHIDGGLALSKEHILSNDWVEFVEP